MKKWSLWLVVMGIGLIGAAAVWLALTRGASMPCRIADEGSAPSPVSGASPMPDDVGVVGAASLSTGSAVVGAGSAVGKSHSDDLGNAQVEAGSKEPGVAKAANDRGERVPEDVSAAIAFAADASIPVVQRQERIAELGRRGDESSLKILKAIADANVYVSSSAIRALGKMPASGVAEYLAEKLRPNANIRVVCAAVQSLAEVEGEKAIPILGRRLEENHRRLDGFEELVWKECASTLGALGSPAALPVLQRELEWVGGEVRHLEYGMQLVEAVVSLNRAEGAAMLERYAVDLERKKPEDPRPKAYFEKRIEEARASAEKLRRGVQQARGNGS